MVSWVCGGVWEGTWVSGACRGGGAGVVGVVVVWVGTWGSLVCGVGRMGGRVRGIGALAGRRGGWGCGCGGNQGRRKRKADLWSAIEVQVNRTMR